MALDRRGMVNAAIRHESTSLVPYGLRFEGGPDQPYGALGDLQNRLDAHYGSPAWRRRLRNYVEILPGANDRKFANAPQRATRDLFGSIWRTDRHPVHLEKPALEGPSLGGYEFPDPHRFYDADWEPRTREALQACADRFTLGSIGFGVFERSWALRGFHEVLMDAAAEPAFFADLIGAIAEHQMRLLDPVLALPFDGVLFSDDWSDQRGIMIGPDRWRTTIKPHVARLFARARAAGKTVCLHSCGAVTEVIPDLIEIGLDVLESVQPEAAGMNPYALKQRFGDRLTFWGGLGSQSLIPNGTPSQLRAEIDRLADEMARGGGYILSCAKPLQPDTPTANAVAVIEGFLAVGEADGRAAAETREP